jgi:hypothetical protein
VAACKKCGGASTIECGACANAAADAAAAARREAAAAWLAGRRDAVDRHVKGEGLLHARSAHVDLAFSIGPMTIDRKRLDTHHLMHLYLERIEMLRTRFSRTLGLDDDDFSARLQVYMFEDCADHQALAPRVAGGGSNSQSMKLMGADAVYCMCRDPRTMPDDEAVYRNIVHNVAHLLLSNMKPEQWLGNRKHGWADCGTAHWFEDLLTGKCTNFCYEEVGVSGGFKSGRWRVPIREYAEAGELEPFATVSSLNTDQLSGKQHAQAFAYVDFLIATRGGETFAALLRLLKQGRPTRDALPESVGLTMLGFDAAFATWVKATYPLREQ